MQRGPCWLWTKRTNTHTHTHTRHQMDYSRPQRRRYCHTGRIKASACFHVSKKPNLLIRSRGRRAGSGRTRCAHALFSSFSLAAGPSHDRSTHTRAHSSSSSSVYTHSALSMCLKHMIALAWCPLTRSCLSLSHRSAERIKVQ